jgi:ankyrin repeat protein
MHNDVSAFIDAIESGDVDRVTRLLDEHPELVSARENAGATALHHAAFHGHRSIVNLLISRGGNVNARDGEHDATPSGWAIHYLRELGGLLAIEIEDTLYAIRSRDAGWVERLVTRHPALVDATDVNGKPLADHASESGVGSIAELFSSAKPRDRQLDLGG